MLLFSVVFLIFALVTDSGTSSSEHVSYYCGGTIREPGVLKSPKPLALRAWPDDDIEELQEMNCIWHIEAPEDKKVVFKITQTLLDGARGKCGPEDDHVAVFDGYTTEAEKRLAIICNRRNSTFIFSSTQNALTVQFKTDDRFKNGGFNSEIIFSYPVSDGCGGYINLTSTTDYILKSPQVPVKSGDILDCNWNFRAPEGMAIKVSFSSFQINCFRDYGLEIRDGNAPNSLLMGSYCGTTLPPIILSSGNKMSIRLSSEGQSHFIATLTVQQETCNSSFQFVGTEFHGPINFFKSPGYGMIPISRGIHCGARFRVHLNIATVVRIKNLDIQPGSSAGKCDKDKLIISVGTQSTENYPGEKYVIESKGAYYLYQAKDLAAVYDDIFAARQFQLCGSHQNIDFYIRGPVSLNLITTPDIVMKNYTGVEIEIFYKPSCDSKNYTEPYGRVMSYGSRSGSCSTLISAPEGYTISVYFIYFGPSPMSNIDYLDIYDGDTTDAKLLNSTKNCDCWPTYGLSPVFSTGNHLLLYVVRDHVLFDAVYMITNKGRGCGGYIFAEQGEVTSPFYPVTYKEAKTCEFELETPVGTHLHIRFADFDQGDDCASNHVQLVNRKGKVLSTFCAAKPNVFTSEDNYLKIISVSSASNRGKGWHVLFGSASLKYF